ncbi:UbiA family prenyltransferase [Williamsia maris]|uniref:4-hydroxybenzoate polyprenyltransferase n=1 Tax=Williamsia maris TaxID=72806 RepID=A0ABT1H9N5_9NOCA|nr:UbiA family prenyltransferase [Williamsia maris]MCP2174966.1 4-hydroxybenzoate polyprenyltransferase [Williamsia maris]
MRPVGVGQPQRAIRTTLALARASHPVPGTAVTLLTVALALTNGVSALVSVALAVAVFAGQLVVGWTNDLFDRGRDVQVGRPDKPLAAGELTPRAVAGTAAVFGVVCVVASMACGVAAGSVHLVLGVGAGLLYNAGVKSTVFSAVPYLVAFGSLPVVVMLAADPGRLPPVWMVVVAGLLGVGAHLLNVFPDLDDDEATGVRGLPHRLGRRRIPGVAAVLLLAATAVCVAATSPSWMHWVALAAVIAIIAATVRGRGRTPFYGAIVVAGVDAVLVIVS